MKLWRDQPDNWKWKPTNKGKTYLSYLNRILGVGLYAQLDEVFQDAWMRIVDARGG
jgi:hypothetical protein